MKLLRVALFLAIALLGGGEVARAQTAQTKATLETTNNAVIVTNSVGAITASALNSLLGNMIYSGSTLLDANTFIPPQTFAGSLLVNVNTIRGPGAVPVSATTDYIICVDKTVGQATTVNLPANPPQGLTILVKDCKGDAATNNITIVPASGQIDGASSYVMNTNSQSVAVTYSGAFWLLN